MPKYNYTAKTQDGKPLRGTAEAADENALYAKLRREGKFLLSQKEAKAGAADGQKLKTPQVADFCRELSTLLTAGVPMARALAIMSEADDLSANTRIVYGRVLANVRRGVPLSDSMENQAPAFPKLLVEMLRSAEGTGSIDKAAARMALHYDKEHKLNQEVGNSMVYPAILGVLLVVFIIFMMAYVLPQFSDLFAGMETLPLPTTILMGVSSLVQNHWLALLLAASLATVVWRMLGTLMPVRLAKAKWKLKAPLIGRLNRKICTARFARTISNLYSGGVPIVLALQAGRDTIGNLYLAGQFDEVLAMVRAGGSLSEALGTVDGFERKLISALAVGEETGQLDTMLASISESMDYEAEMATKKLMALLEPVMIVVLAVVVALVVVAVILPIYQSYATIGASGAI